MESLLIFIAIFVIDALIKRANAKKKSQQQPPPWQNSETDSSHDLEDETSDEDFDERTDEDAPPEPKPFAAEQEMKAKVMEMKAKLVEAEAQIPMAMATALRDGKLGVMDYYNLKNIEADTQMRKEIGTAPETTK